ncbi:hypothetical protein METBIDRAFT_33680 [Metschnikowia bicuspidata var. bicuspidata NRRL YB-4993]|uniref:RNase MRP protein 1 RNA binding domain-containing protein n=1 Tax=Metschnikowia bicuspidata var. bicuspidata NRRL YB-4993 TaxID=869754 RepID=A0A1A0H582_9ASCO|nr:hypothetical protein METBIDRAFT_33680 [Metschnikowia bicuspidata var. bicuspidata NRRL YB-4993]OBA19067.1 hypothetical protein METBIDRAFT_33680 [Metschnikowia bicuspidata var. bicuspidata NRRL YB-4993]
MTVKTSQQIFSPEIVQKLENEYGILHLICHRNRNQHRVAVWWKDLNQLHRSVRKILRAVYHFEEVTKYAIKEKLHAEALGVACSMIKKRLSQDAFILLMGLWHLGSSSVWGWHWWRVSVLSIH